MSAGVILEGFAYGEHLDGSQGRSLGFRLLVPEIPQSWTAEVETLARRLQSAPYPDHWPVTDLFCSVLMADGQRLIGLARFGVEDHTPGKRRGGMELVGVVGPNTLSINAVLAVYQWLRCRRAGAEDLRILAGKYDLVEVLAEAPAPASSGEPVPVLPIRLWQEGALVFAASTPGDPDLRLGMLAQSSGPNWQWVPFVGPDFPMHVYTQRGPLIAWTPQFTGVAMKWEPTVPLVQPDHTGKRTNWLAWVLATVLLAAFSVNAWLIWRLDQRWAAQPLPERSDPASKVATPSGPIGPAVSTPTADTEQISRALYHYLRLRGCIPSHNRDKEAALRAYEQLVSVDPQFEVQHIESKLALGVLSDLTRRSPAQIQRVILEIGEKKGIDERVLEIIAERVGQRLQGGE